MLLTTKSAYGQIIGTHAKFELNAGIVFSHHDGFGIARGTIALNDLVANNRKYGMGLYVTPEYKAMNLFAEDNTPYYFRIPMGVTLKLHPAVGIFGGVDFISWANGKNPRSELGVVWVLSNSLTMRMGYSQWVGATFGIGYQWTLVDTPHKH